MTDLAFTVASMGHPQHGKSSLLGCLALHLRGEDHLEVLRATVEEKVRQLGRPELRYSLLFDLPKNDFAYREQALGRHPGDPTKTMSRLPGWVGCRIGGRNAMLVDEPGHPQFLKYIVAPTASADVGILVVDSNAYCEDYDQAVETIGRDCFCRSIETRRGPVPLLLKRARDERRATSANPRDAASKKSEYWVPQLCIGLVNYLALCEVFGIAHIIVAVHQLDKAGFTEDAFKGAVRRLLEMTSFLALRAELQFVPTAVLAAREEEHNVCTGSPRTPWYEGPTVAQALGERASRWVPPAPGGAPFRLQVERIAEASRRDRHAPPPRVFGRIDSGVLRPGDSVLFVPSQVPAKVKSIRLRDESRFLSARPYWDGASWDVKEVKAGAHVSIALIGREFDAAKARLRGWQGQLLVHPGGEPICSRWLQARLQIVPPWWLEERLTGLTMLYGYERVSCQLPWLPGHQERWWDSMAVPVVCERPIPVDVFQPGGALGKIVLERDGFIVAGGTITAVLDKAPQ